MSPMPTNLITLIAAGLPLIVVLFLMIGRNWGGSKAGVVGMLTAIIISLVFFGANFELLVVAIGRSLLLSFYVLYIIWMALLLYHVINDAGAIKIIGDELPGFAKDNAAQALFLGWVFGSFLQGASGFGVPAAVVAPLLAGLGFPPNSAVVIALVGHAWAVTFGSLGSSFFSLIAASGQPGEVLAGNVALYLGLCCLLCGLVVLWETDKLKAIKRRFGQLIGVGIIMASVQFGLAKLGLWSIAAFGAGAAGLAAMLLDFRFGILDIEIWRTRIVNARQLLRPTMKRSKQKRKNDPSQHNSRKNKSKAFSVSFIKIPRQLGKALFPYLLLTVIVITGQLLIKDTLGFVLINPTFPAVKTSLGFGTAAGPGRSVSLFGHAGALLLYTSVLSYWWFLWQGPFTAKAEYKFSKIARKTVRGSAKSTVGIVTLVAMAVIMQHAGMTQMLAQGISAGTGPAFPFISPFIGALGAFMTGSNTNSNVVFAQLQLETAITLGFSLAFILAAQTAGGAIGSLFAPAKVIVGCSTVEGATDSTVLKRATIYGLLIILVLGCIVWLTVRFL